jgi:hypothetical protein
MVTPPPRIWPNRGPDPRAYRDFQLAIDHLHHDARTPRPPPPGDAGDHRSWHAEVARRMRRVRRALALLRGRRRRLGIPTTPREVAAMHWLASISGSTPERVSPTPPREGDGPPPLGVMGVRDRQAPVPQRLAGISPPAVT